MTSDFLYIPHSWNDSAWLAAGGFVAVVLNYNKKGLIGAAARSALQQDFPCYEVLMLDDCSTDGSREEMLSVAREYAEKGGRSKVTVVFNKENRTILGQWKLALDLSPRGKWFVMFCGDDTSRSERLTVLGNLAETYPDAWGVCTNFNPSNHARYTYKTGVQVWRGTEQQRPIPHFYGCAAMWRRETLEADLPRYNLDDFFLFWSVIIRRQNADAVSLVWDLDHVCVDYSVGTGITTKDDSSAPIKDSGGSWWRRTWAESKRVHKNNVRFGTTFWEKVLAFDQRYGQEGMVRDQIRAHARLASMDDVGWFARLWVYIRYSINQPAHVADIARSIRRRFYERVMGSFSYCAYAFLEKVKNGGW